jgi:aminopeptidase N
MSTMKKIILGVFLIFSFTGFSQKPESDKSESWKKIYRATATRINDLVHTKLDVSFDFSKSWLYGKAWITFHPHFYSTDSLTLDAKSMNINEVSIIRAGKHIPLKYTYDNLNLKITLDRTYSGDENYIVYIDYIARPNDNTASGSSAISDSKGLYFINPLGKDKDKPVQIWTQGETESNSGWFPTIDKPNQKTTDEISMTVPEKYQTLSNGLLVSRKKHNDGTRTDTWKMDLPHAPYLVMMAVGEYSIIKDSYKGKEVSYYVEKEYAPVARKIFGLTPEMIDFFSRLTGVDFPWQKYSQITVRDYVSGAMENTTATVHGDFAQQDARQLVDENNWEDVIAHELFHSWFGDYVTCESWSNLTMNESFADLSETWWEEYKHGKDAGDATNFSGMQTYLRSGSEKKDLVRFYYKDKEDMFDAVSYQKGGCILNMLENYVGDSAFFKTLNLYLRTKKFGSAEAQDLRLDFEEITGEDLNWFWNQWFYGKGHPKLDIDYKYNAGSKTSEVFIKQTQPDKIFKLPVTIDVYQGGEKKRYKVWVENQADTFAFPSATRPDLINFDGEKILVCEKTDHKTLENYIFQYKNAGLYVDRREAIDFAAARQKDDYNALAFLKEALKDKYFGLRLYTLRKLNTGDDSIKKSVELLITDMAKNDPNPLVRAGAISVLGKYNREMYKSLFLQSINDSSYSIAGSALLALGAIDSSAALERAKILSVQNVKGELSDAIITTLFLYSGENEFETLAERFDKLPFGNEKFSMLQSFADYLKRLKNTPDFMKGIDMIVRFRESIPEQYRQQTESYFNGLILNNIATSKQASGLTEQAEFVRSKIPDKTKNREAYVVPKEVLQKYTGEFDYEGRLVRVILKDDKTLYLVFPEQPETELVPLSKGKFGLKYMEEYSIEFTTSEKGEVTGMLMTTRDRQVKAPKKK